MTLSIIERIAQMYGLTPVSILPVQKGFRNSSYAVLSADGQWRNIIIYKTEPGILAKIKNANTVSDFLATKRFATRQTLSDILQLRAQPATYSALYNYLPGQTIPWNAYTMRHLKLLGSTMSTMHQALKELALPTLPNVIAICQQYQQAFHKYFTRQDVTLAMRQKLQLSTMSRPLNLWQPLLAAMHGLAEVQALHMDFVRGNILFNEPDGQLAISGILDFEKTAFGPKVFDIARTLAFLLVDCQHKSAAKVRKYFLISGYNKRGAGHYTAGKVIVGDVKVDTLEALIDFFLTYDFYKFLCHNPYEHLWQNEHFMATRNLMLQRKLLKMIE